MMMANGKKYIQFADPEVERICIANFSSDGKGVTYEDAEAVTDIGTVFRYTTALTFEELKYFTGVTDIPSLSFANTNSLATITLPDSLKTISGQAFNYASGLTSIIIPESVTSIGQYAFINNANLATAILLPTNPPTLDGGNFSNPSKIFVPYSADHSILNAYLGTSGWSNLSNKIYELNPDGTIPT